MEDEGGIGEEQQQMSMSPARTKRAIRNFESPLGAKRQRMQALPAQLPLAKLLEPLGMEQLVGIICAMAEVNAYEVNERLRLMVPQPSMDTVSVVIHRLQTQLLQRFPYAKGESVFDTYAYLRVRSCLTDIRDTLLAYSNHFFHPASTTHPATLFAFLHYAAGVAEQLPDWEQPEHNQLKHDLLEALATQWVEAVSVAVSHAQTGHLVGQETVDDWARNLVEHYRRTPHVFQQAVHALMQSFGWVMSSGSMAMLRVPTQINDGRAFACAPASSLAFPMPS